MSRPEAVAILAGDNEGFNHLSVHEVAVELVELAQPEVVTVEIQSCLGRVVGIPAEVTEVFHQHKRAVGFLLFEE